jgi:AdoMet-dependent heme synthase
MLGTPFDFFVQLHVTEGCNLSCRHCYQAAPGSEMNFQEICGVMAEIKRTIEDWAIDYDMDVSPSLHFTGGEPLLRSDLMSLLSYACGCGFSVSIMSNGTLIDRTVARRLKQMAVSDVQISLDGLEDTHDSIRGSGSFRRTLEGIDSLVKEGLETNINLTLSRLNLQDTDGLVQLAEELGVSGIAFSRLVPCGRGESLADQTLSSQEVGDFYRSLRASGEGGRVAVTSRDPLAVVEGLDGDVPQTDIPVSGCAAGMFGITVTADGTMMPCRRMDLPIGNVRTDSFRQVWADSPVLWDLRKRERYHGPCQTCRYWPVCRGCRAVALAYARARGTEDYLGPDPQCSYYQPSEG